MKSNFKFDAATGTMKAVSGGQGNTPKTEAVQAVRPGQEMTKLDMGKNVLKPNVAGGGNEPEVIFKQQSDYKMFQILDEDTRAVMGYIGGYDLDISFNLGELRSVEKIEQFLEALRGLFRKIISNQILSQNK